MRSICEVICWWGFIMLRGKIIHPRVVSLVLGGGGAGQPGPGLSTPHLHDKHQVPGLVKGLSPRLVVDSTFLLLGLDLLPGSLPVASLLRSVPLVPVLASLRNLDWHLALELVLPLVIKDNEPLQSIQPQLSRKGTRHVSRSSQRHYCNRKHLALTL